MRRDSIFYKLFQQYPNLLFELLTNPPINADAYRFDSVAVNKRKGGRGQGAGGRT
ncbi:MAG: DUF2887 domain-containing protein [Trichormus sp.]